MLSINSTFFATLASAAFIAGTASAATISTSIDFDAGSPTYENAAGSSATIDGYFISPTNIQSGLCETMACTIESGQATQTEITRLDNTTFSLIDFWFSPTGKAANPVLGDDGELIDNFFSVTAIKGAVETTIQFALGDMLSSFSPLADVTWAAGEGATGSASATCQAEICKNEGYRVTLTSAFFQDVDKISWSAKGSGQSRLDTINVERTSIIPLPAAGWLLLAGLGGLAALRRNAS
ncbi:VPLPA-CTERM sorting domain-containing protein [Roseovarius sp. EL26]|uniref:VPLPA-CTERM sorting domain-containing protein n=1 Tax=Roseovarius sp. EL26 TaxID=2126672 RepID=UPI000EA3D49B|nr:VPLPA-CTERM sorting domain-containing protein [Roseovarius sp. EL26]